MLDKEQLKQLQEQFKKDHPTSSKKNKHEESTTQIGCVRWFRMQYPYPKYLITTFANGGVRDKITAGIMKKEGLWAGMPDLFIPYPNGEYHGLFIEMKNGKIGVVSGRQKETMEYLTNQGYKCVVARSFSEFTQAVKDYIK